MVSKKRTEDGKLTLPINIILPLRSEAILSNDPKKHEQYQREFVFRLQQMYADIVQNVNGDIREFSATVSGTTLTGVGTYDHQTGWLLRQGLMVDIWFDVQWTAHTGTGNLFLNLPYKVFNTRPPAVAPGDTSMPFVGVLQPSSVTFASGTASVINAIPNTFRGEIWSYGDGIPTENVAIAGTGQIIGHIRYVGTEFER